MKGFTATEVGKHNTPESCWVVLYGDIYDVTSFIPQHPGGSRAILQLGGRDATEEYDPIHPPGALDELPTEAKIGRFMPDPASNLETTKAQQTEEGHQQIVPLEHMLNIDDIEQVATAKISKKAWSYYFSAADDLLSKSLNNTAYRSILLRPRVLVNCTTCDTSTTLLGNPVSLPLYVAPAAMARLAHPTGEAGIAAACSVQNTLQVVSANASMTPEQIIADAKPGQVFGWQLYVQNQRDKSEAVIRRINAMKQFYKFIVLTVDAPVPGKREMDEKEGFKAAAEYFIKSAATGDLEEDRRPGSGGVGQQLFFGTASDLTWETTLPWLAEHSDLPIVLKGLQTHEDAYLAAKYAPQVKGIMLSNHGGRALDTAPPAIHTLMEIRKYCPEVLSKVEVWVDGGIKRGTDIVKALCLGARGVGIGRAALYGLGAGGPRGVERVFEILRGEVETCMRLLGAEKISELGPRFINSRALEAEIYDGPSNLDTGLWAKAKL